MGGNWFGLTPNRIALFDIKQPSRLVHALGSPGQEEVEHVRHALGQELLKARDNGTKVRTFTTTRTLTSCTVLPPSRLDLFNLLREGW